VASEPEEVPAEAATPGPPLVPAAAEWGQQRQRSWLNMRSQIFRR
jgi:hypothetical protein